MHTHAASSGYIWGLLGARVAKHFIGLQNIASYLLEHKFKGTQTVSVRESFFGPSIDRIAARTAPIRKVEQAKDIPFLMAKLS